MTRTSPVSQPEGSAQPTDTRSPTSGRTALSGTSSRSRTSRSRLARVARYLPMPCDEHTVTGARYSAEISNGDPAMYCKIGEGETDPGRTEQSRGGERRVSTWNTRG